MVSRSAESDINRDKTPQERCRRKSDSGLYVKPVETDVMFARLRQVESRLLERERRQPLQGEIANQVPEVSGEILQETSSGFEMSTSFKYPIQETMKGYEKGMFCTLTFSLFQLKEFCLNSLSLLKLKGFICQISNSSLKAL